MKRPTRQAQRWYRQATYDFEQARRAAETDECFATLVDTGRRLDRHYLMSRYPDALPEPAIPAESYTRGDAEDALMAAATILRVVQEASGFPPEQTPLSSAG